MQKPEQSAVVKFNELEQPGCYVTAQGSLVRVPEDAIKAQHSPLITIESKDDTRLTKISDNPFEPIGKARLLAANADLAVNF
ncbi:MAG: hypothetical protein Q8Q90_00430 [bacterium]|nr:hypothetical protein [bacterium]